eukprot:CAMPEP_0119552422 /NCGR_PEP_ID=MMETSP1352-20130426/5432_1 /TAXON_ID=265584 /ORGANISM="Stauroneis constricta, Strain CCMP1120" /LENGTH=276 /DNA_ID=CAMNT_0007598663 /DNA_START=191 /DNA_END=1018 /DNA_ORIENTATION=+
MPKPSQRRSNRTSASVVRMMSSLAVWMAVSALLSSSSSSIQSQPQRWGVATALDFNQRTRRLTSTTIEKKTEEADVKMTAKLTKSPETTVEGARVVLLPNAYDKTEETPPTSKATKAQQDDLSRVVTVPVSKGSGGAVDLEAGANDEGATEAITTAATTESITTTTAGTTITTTTDDATAEEPEAETLTEETIKTKAPKSTKAPDDDDDDDRRHRFIKKESKLKKPKSTKSNHDITELTQSPKTIKSTKMPDYIYDAINKMPSNTNTVKHSKKGLK